jgi:uncharacterized protein (TIGR03067 family)
MRHAIGLAFLAALALPVWADDKPALDEKLVGTWVITSVDVGGKKFPKTPDSECFVFDKGGKFTLKARGGRNVDGTWKVMGTKNPKAMDMRFSLDGRPVAFIAIYELDGDELKVAYSIALPGSTEERPTGFDSAEGITVVTLKRQKP